MSAAARSCPPLPGVDAVPYLDQRLGMMQLTELPDHLVVIGGSYIGLEFAQMFRRFGARSDGGREGRRGWSLARG
jgi:pyruvate/2-oxoglutarate dehydrogenase complex dihydrolipoamide dehydrogenase (E3) component